MLKRWVVFPLRDARVIEDRLDVVEYFFRHPEVKELLEEKLEQIGDLERIISQSGGSAASLPAKWYS